MADTDSCNSAFEQCYRCYSVSFIDKAHLEKGDKIIMPPSALDRLASLHIEYPMLFKVSNNSAEKFTHCGVLEFVADEGIVYLPYWMMQNLLLEEGDLVQVRNTSLEKGTYIKLQPHTQDFLDVSNPKAILETSLRSYSCLTTGDTIMVPYNNKRYFIDVVDTRPAAAISIIETDCEVDFAPPLDYKEIKKPAETIPPAKRPAEAPDEPVRKAAKFTPFMGPGRRLDGKPSKQPTEAPVTSATFKEREPNPENGAESVKLPTSSSHQRCGRLVFGSNSSHASKETSKVNPKTSGQENSPEVEQPKFQAFTGKKYSLKG